MALIEYLYQKIPYFDQRRNMKSITSSKENNSLLYYLKEVIKYRILIFNLVRRDLKVKYAQTFLGLLWVIIQPLTGVIIFTFFFKYLMDISSWQLGIPYHIYAFCGFNAWLLFSSSLQNAGMALSNEEQLIKKVYFPRLILPIVKTINSMIDFVVASVILLLMAIVSDVKISGYVILFPIILILTAMVSLSISIWLSALTIRYRDFSHIIPYVVSFGIWLTPVFYPSSILPEQFAWLLNYNPMSCIVDLFRWSLFDTAFPINSIKGLFIPLILLLTGLVYFRKVEKLISDYL